MFSKTCGLPFVALGLGLTVAVMVPNVVQAQLHDPCPSAWLNDGDCDEPEGLNLCAEGTDVADCSNPNANYGTGSGYGTSGGGGGYSGGAVAADVLRNPCPSAWLNDGDCDEPEGLNLCAEGTDVVDCANPNANYGTGSGYGTSGHGSTAATGGSGAGTYSAWTRITNDQRHYATQPGGVLALTLCGGMNFEPGDYVLYHGVTDGSGPYAAVRDIQSMNITLSPNTRYLAIPGSHRTLRFERGGASTMMYNVEQGRAMIYARNDDIYDWRALCILPVGTPQSVCDVTLCQYTIPD